MWRPIVAQVGVCVLRRPDDGDGSRRWRRWPAAAAAADLAPPRALARGSGGRRGCVPRRRWAGRARSVLGRGGRLDTVGRRGHAQPSCGVRVPCSVDKPRWLVHVQRTFCDPCCHETVFVWVSLGEKACFKICVLSLVNMSFCISWRPHPHPQRGKIMAHGQDAAPWPWVPLGAPLKMSTNSK